MADKMLIDATHPEETRVVVVRGNRVEEFDFESANRKQLRGNIYLAKVTRVEPSLQAAFVDYGGNRHGFLAFSEIHPDYYQIPVADRQALIEQEARDQREADDEHEQRRGGGGGRRRRHRQRGSERPRRDRDEVVQSQPYAEGEPPHDENGAPVAAAETETPSTAGELPEFQQQASTEAFAEPETPSAVEAPAEPAPEMESSAAAVETAPASPASEFDVARAGEAVPVEAVAMEGEAPAPSEAEPSHDDEDDEGDENGENGEHEDEVVESVGGADAMEEVQERVPRFRRQYKIQEVIKRRQVMLVQVVKEERGTKGAALTTYLSLAGRYSVLMPNTARGGGISRKITSGEDRSRLKEIAQELEVPEGMGVILRTAGASRTKMEVKRDFEYLLRLWETVRDLTLKSMAPTLVYEEGSLVKRSIRDLYSKDIDEVIVAGEAGYKEARDFMRMLMPSHVKNVKLYSDAQPLFTRYGIESQLDAMFQPTVQLRSGGYIVINQTEALVAIDVNSGRATREHHIEDTALKTNCEAADEVADLGDMGEHIVGGHEVGALALADQSAGGFDTEESDLGIDALGPGRFGDVGGGLDAEHGHTRGLEMLKEVAVIGGDLDHQGVSAEFETLDHCVRIALGMRDPAVRIGREIGIVGIEQFVGAREILRLHQPAMGANEQLQREIEFRRLQLVLFQVRVRGRRES